MLSLSPGGSQGYLLTQIPGSWAIQKFGSSSPSPHTPPSRRCVLCQPAHHQPLPRSSR